MDFLRNQIRNIQAQLVGLSASQRLLAGALVVIMAMTLVWWSNYAGRSEMAAVLDQPIAADDMATITARLRAQGISYRVVGDRIQVSSDRRDEVLADLAYSQLLPRDTKNAFDELISKSSPFQSSRMTEALWVQVKQQTLAQVVRRFPRVSHAMVLIDPTRERGPAGVQPSATVNITMRSGESADAKLVNAAADLVSGAVANLVRSRVKVIVDGASYPVKDRDEQRPSSDEYLAQVEKAERYYIDKLAQQFSFIEGVKTSVTVKPNLERRDSVEHKVDPKNVVQKATSEESTNEENRSTQKNGGEPGVMSNAGMAVGDAPAADHSSGATETNKTEYMVDSGRADIKTSHPGGDLSVIAATVLVPRSHFIQSYKKRTGMSEGNPDNAALSQFIGDELKRLKPSVKLCLGLSSDDGVHVDEYTDLMPLAAGNVAGHAASAGISLAVTDHAKEIAIGVLALISLFMVSHMVKKNSPAAAAPVPIVTRPTPQLESGEEAVGEAGEGVATLDGMEVDEDSVKASQMLSQVSQMVGENPEAAANLVKRWMNK